MYWIPLTALHQLDEIIAASHHTPQIIFKHSTRCSISSVVKNRLEAMAAPAVPANFYYLDLLAYRSVSNAIAERLGVYHESPQILIIKNGACVFDESHTAIQPSEILEQIA